MKAAIINKETGKPEIVDVPIPEIQEGEILFKPMACGVCGSDVIDWNINGPGSFGHEPAGIVVKVGKNVKNVKEGDRIFVHHRVPNPDCRFFRRGHGTVCPEYPQYGFIPSAYAEFTRVTERHVRLDLIHLPDHISFEVGALIAVSYTHLDVYKRQVYGASKGGIITLTRSIARELGPYGITCNAIAPHAIMTKMMSYWDEEKKKKTAEVIPVKRLGTVEDVSNLIMFLASDKASFITGETININGGYYMD